jgi:hypothetical protein
MNMNFNDNTTPGCRSFGMSNGPPTDHLYTSQVHGIERVGSLDHPKVTDTGIGHYVPAEEGNGTEVETTDVLCGRGKISFNHGKQSVCTGSETLIIA